MNSNTIALHRLNIRFKCCILWILLFIFFNISKAIGQPEICGPEAEMTSFCADACVICDIDGFTGNNNLTAQGQGFSGFCTTQYNNMQYIAFIAGSVDLTIRVDVGVCIGGINSLEVGFFESTDCENFTPITICDTDIPSNTSQVFTNLTPLTVGQYYYLIMDGSNGANCDWTFNVEEGTTEVLPLENSGDIEHSGDSCPDNEVTFTTTPVFGASDYTWYIEGNIQVGNDAIFTTSFPENGTYEVCVIASNVCDEAPQSCTLINISTPGASSIDTTLCEGECIEVNGTIFCETGFYEEVYVYENGCDSLIQLNVEVLNQPQTALDVWICNDQNYNVGSSSYSETGNYLDTILTAANCDSLVFLDLLVIECEILLSSEESPALCAGTPSGQIIFSIDQGTPPFTYTYTNIADPSIAGNGMTDLLINNEISNVAAGTYQIYVSDEFGNDGVILQEVTEPPALQLELLPSDYNGFNVSCFNHLGEAGNDGSLTAIPSFGTPPYSFLWNTEESDPTILGLQAQNYSVTITDLNGCSIEQNFTLVAPDPINPNIQFIDPNCDGENTGEIDIESVSGGIPSFTFALNDTLFSSQSTYSTLAPGFYTVFVEDANGCIEIVTGTLTAADIPSIAFDEDLTICLGDSVQLMPILSVGNLDEIIWTETINLSCFDCVQPIAKPYANETFYVRVISQDGCIDSTSVTIRVDNKRRIYVPNIFTPNNDGLNDFFFPFAAQEVAQIQDLIVYDRWGEKIYEATEFKAGAASISWDGTFKARNAQAGVYSWVMNVLYLDGSTDTLYGTITLSR